MKSYYEIVSVSELNHNSSKYVNEVIKGKTVFIVKNSRIVAKIVKVSFPEEMRKIETGKIEEKNILYQI